jgi:Holliday junction resolvasome RuvABC DNA-binding subunit
MHSEAVSALQSLGFKPQEAKQMVTDTAKDNPKLTVEEIVRLCLQQKGGS